ncbi:WcbI family polysaccharide biosynthesis putative acetyltransferase, partial [Rheinheimera baltica]|uniref:WcbI family polysaccharide biosynthesis putative acetyltransferase n=1 Tax=Rheinheimera baltica TaxID=67576 RepID=UPI00273F9CE9
EPFLLNSFHPDICYVKDIGGNLLRTKMGDYNSIIVLSGFLLGLSVEEVVKLFNGELFQRFGFFDLWIEDVKRLQEKNSLKLNWAYLLRDESRSGSFMFTFNHPKSSILFEISKQILKYLGVGYHSLSSNCIPSYLANGPVWPVYPDIAERFTMKGDFFFKPADSWSVFNLKTFVETSFEEYSKLGIKENSLTVFGCGNRFEQVMAVLKGKLS